jgi:hypothetical protein
LDRVDVEGGFREVLEDQDKIELLETVLHTFEGGDFNVGESDNEERRVREVDQTLCGGLQANTCTEWNTFEGKLSERDIDF